MGESAESPVEIENIPFSAQVTTAMNELAEGIGAHSEAFTEIVAHELEYIRSGAKPPELIPFDIDGKSYGYSAAVQEAEGVEPIKALRIVEGDRSLFLQVSRSLRDSNELFGEVEFLTGDEHLVGKEALSRAREGFPEFYPVPKAQAA